MTLVRGCASHRITARANARLADIRLRAGIAIVAGRAICFGRVGTGAGVGVEGASHMTLVQGGANHQGAYASTIPVADISLRGRISIVAGRADGLWGMGAGASSRVASSSFITLIGGGANHGVAARADTGLAGVRLRAGVAVIASRSIRF